MSNIDKRALREAAEKALLAMKRLLMMPNDELFDEALLNVDGDVDAANAFNLHAGPETVLALLDELEVATDACNGWQRKFAEADERLQAAEKRIAELTEKPIGWTDEQELRDVEKLGCGYLFNANPITPHADPRRVILLHAAAAGKGE